MDFTMICKIFTKLDVLFKLINFTFNTYDTNIAIVQITRYNINLIESLLA